MDKINNIISLLELYEAAPNDLNKKNQQALDVALTTIESVLGSNYKPSRNRLEEILHICTKISSKDYNVTYNISEKEDNIDAIGTALSSISAELNYSSKTLTHYDNRINDLIDVLSSYSQLDFSITAPLSDKHDEIDAIAFGLNMLGQEINFFQKQLQEKTKSLEEAQRIGKVGSWEWMIEDDEIIWSNQLYKIFDVPSDTRLDFNKYAALLDKKTLEELGALVDKIFKDGKPYFIIHPLILKDGTLKYIQSVGEIVMKDGKPFKLMGTALDVTEQHKAKLELAELNKTLEEKVAERTADLESFTYSVSHDLRAPLRAITGFSEILEEDYQKSLDKEGLRLLNIISNNAKRMSQLIDDLLKFSRLNNQNISFNTVDLNLMIQDLEKELIASYPNEKIRFKVAKLPKIKGDLTLLKQVWQNLIDNAIKYSSNNDQIEVEIKVNKDAKYHSISITDNGVGFDEKYKDKLFEVFQRLHPQNEFSGTGVGLSIVKRILDKHNGKISATSKVGKGATFTIQIPKTL